MNFLSSADHFIGTIVVNELEQVRKGHISGMVNPQVNTISAPNSIEFDLI
jgi:hypothetical protein